jgi:hypothetical protein
VVLGARKCIRPAMSSCLPEAKKNSRFNVQLICMIFCMRNFVITSRGACAAHAHVSKKFRKQEFYIYSNGLHLTCGNDTFLKKNLVRKDILIKEPKKI